MNFENGLKRVLQGTMIGDSLGLPAEGVSGKNIAKLGWNQWRQRLFFGKGMLSDDSEHSFMLAASLLQSRENSDSFIKKFGSKLKWWLAAIPAGIGFGTMRAIFKLIFGFPPTKSGVFSAGNGPAMRAAILGVYFHDKPEERRKFTELSTKITHTDPKALIGTLAIVEFAAHIFNCERPNLEELENLLKSCGNDTDWQKIVDLIILSLKSDRVVNFFAKELGCKKGVSGYIYQTVPVAIYAVMRNYGDFRKILESMLNLGGDTDTVGAITGALAALTTEDNLPKEWLDSISEWPRSPQKYEKLAEDLALMKSGQEPRNEWKFFVPGLIPRNLFFTVTVLTHGFMRLLPKSLLRLIIK